ncbi:MAG: pantoate--beta-alanine ligase [Flavobacteriales bacterium]|nr:pantoate--beta-alanine ligase [Flavobacteriales bacterium]
MHPPDLEALAQPPEAAAWSARQRRRHKRVAFVPTMGALHEGHLSLVHEARRHGDVVAVSIFVNPLQFNDPKDLERYPRQPERDRDLLAGAGVDMLLLPEGDGLFRDFTPAVHDLGGLDLMLEGASRPGHFQGVVNVVERLFHYVRPDVALFGEKDRQQLAVIRHAARQQRWPVEIVGCPIVRAADGLALSSRNQRLSGAERRAAPALYRALCAIRDAAATHTAAQALEAGQRVLAEEPLVVPDYLTLAHPETLLPLPDWDGRGAVALVAAQVGPVRLIDNMMIRR